MKCLIFSNLLKPLENWRTKQMARDGKPLIQYKTGLVRLCSALFGKGLSFGGEGIRTLGTKGFVRVGIGWFLQIYPP